MTPFPTIEPTTHRRDFRSVFCGRFGHSLKKFEKKLFWQAVDPNIKPVAFAISCLHPGFFRRDFECIRRIAATDTPQDVAAIVNGLPYDPRFNRGFLRGFLRIRISGRRLVRIANQLFAQ
jgi:hypothetical protein